jgi:Tfp pilus assembly protein PilO
VPIASGIGILGVLIFLAIRMDAPDLAAAQVRERQTEADRLETNLRNANNLETHLKTLQTELARLEEKLIKADDVSSNQAFFYGLEAKTGVKMPVMRPTGPAKPLAKDPVYQVAGYSVSVEGSYSQVTSFLWALENSDRLYRLGDMTLQRSTQDPKGLAGVVLTLNLQLLAKKS